HGIRVRLQGKPLQVLRALIEEPGRIVTRQELRHKLWPSGTFVDFESGLNTAVNRLRIALGDSADNPIYVETVSRSGYRFIAPVKFSAPADGEPISEPAAVSDVSLPREEGLISKYRNKLRQLLTRW